jgi:hypothetical protein
MPKPTINIGCGGDSWGDIRIDVSKHSSANLLLDFDRVPLPFEDKFFSEARMFHVLEHSRNPQRLVGEALRVADRVHARFPYKYDRVPFILIDTGDIRAFPVMIRDCVFDVAAQLGLSDHPSVHRWMVKPFGRHRVNSKDVTPFCSRLKNWVLSTRVSRTTSGQVIREAVRPFLVRVPPIMMKAEWECWYP